MMWYGAGDLRIEKSGILQVFELKGRGGWSVNERNEGFFCEQL